MKIPAKDVATRVKLLLMAMLIVALPLVADEPATQEPAKPKDAVPTVEEKRSTADLVAAARSSKKSRGKRTSKVLTNADAKKATGRVVENTAVSADDRKYEKPVNPFVAHEASLRAKDANQKKVVQLEAKVAKLEQELATAEQAYFDEDDLDRRDGTLKPQFDQIRTRLQIAREELAAARPPATTTGTRDP